MSEPLVPHNAGAQRSNLPPEVVQASAIGWAQVIDAYLVDAALVGGRYAARAFMDKSGEVLDGMTVVTPLVETIAKKSGFLLVRSLSHRDHYVIASLHGSDQE